MQTEIRLFLRLTKLTSILYHPAAPIHLPVKPVCKYFNGMLTLCLDNWESGGGDSEFCLTLLHSGWPKLYRVLASLSAIGSMLCNHVSRFWEPMRTCSCLTLAGLPIRPQ